MVTEVGDDLKGYTAIAGWVKDVPVPVLGRIDLTGKIVTADTLHTVKAVVAILLCRRISDGR